MTPLQVDASARARSHSRALWAATVVVALVAFLTRAWLVLRYAGLNGLNHYDDGVYYAGAAALVAGRIPYSDFLFLHPPGIMLALSPFAALGALTSDSVGLAVARVTFWGLGALNAALVARVLARQGLVAAVVGGLGYALWYPAIYNERTTLLEALGNTGLIVALLLLGRSERSRAPGAEVLAGVSMGLAACVKIWMVVPLGVLVAWQTLTHGWRAAARIATGSVAAALAVLLPFVGVAPDVFRMVVLDQLGRPRTSGLLARLSSITGLRPLGLLVPDLAEGAVLLLVLALMAVAVVVAARRPGHPRLFVALFVAHFGLLVASPSYFEHYGAVLSIPWALVLGTAVARVPRRHGRRLWPVPLAVTSALLLHYGTTLGVQVGEPFPAARLAAATPSDGCVVSDDPTALALTDVLSRDLRRGCRVLVDTTGETYDRAAMQRPDGTPVPRAENTLWQRTITDYLMSGSALVLARDEGAGLSDETRRRLAVWPLLAREGRFEVRGRP